jgi:hypothetical protein
MFMVLLPSADTRLFAGADDIIVLKTCRTGKTYNLWLSVSSIISTVNYREIVNTTE